MLTAATVISLLVAVVFLVNFAQISRAQEERTTFMSLVSQYVNKEVEINSGDRTYYVTLEALGYDYVVFADHQGNRTAVPNSVVTSIRLGDKPAIHVSY